tara:strand:- start:225 stop:473 length:249 start_codon:yes stop_codon:yes gene_type:complete
MAINTFIHELALQMLEVDELPLDLRNYLDDIDMYAYRAGGIIQSRQIVALALVNYLDRKAYLKRIKDLEEEVHKKLDGPFYG